MKRSPPARTRRPRHPMPNFIREALEASGLRIAYDERPPYQRNDYIGWITRARLPTTRQKRLAQMLDELASGDGYMNMPYRTKKSASPGPEGAELKNQKEGTR